MLLPVLLSLLLVTAFLIFATGNLGTVINWIRGKYDDLLHWLKGRAD